MFSFSGTSIGPLSATRSPIRASERLRPDLHELAQAAQVVRRGFPVQVQRRSRQADAAQGLATPLLQAGEDVFDARPSPGDAPVALRLALRQRTFGLALALDVQAPPLLAQTLLALSVDLAFVGPDVAASVAAIEHALEVQGVVLAGRAHMHAADQFVAPIHAAGAVRVRPRPR